MYFVKARRLLKWLYPSALVWDIKGDAVPTVYLTFDDGPHPVATPFVLDQLKQFNLKATFFCIGKNVIEYPHIYQRILDEGHAVGNHTHRHLNGWKVPATQYLESVHEAARYINSKCFRPPYGRITGREARALTELGYKIYMWDVLSADFDTKITPEQCWQNVALYLQPGAILVFHDSAKAWERMQYALPRTLEFCTQRGWKLGILA
jgi:peptidoglycan/xylan/chitin deacetylase (PgdA/CDA1 family)